MYGLTSINKLNRLAAEADAILKRHAAQGDRSAAECLAAKQRLQETVAEHKEVHISPTYTKALRRGEVLGC